MRKILIIISLLLGLVLSFRAQIVNGVKVDGLRMDRSVGYLSVDMDLDLSDLL